MAARRVPVILLENVVNMLSLGKGTAMDGLLRPFERLGYRWCYRTVDARALGLPQRRCDRFGPESEFGEDLCHRERVGDVRLAALSFLSRVRRIGDPVGLLDDGEVALRVVCANRPDEGLDVITSGRARVHIDVVEGERRLGLHEFVLEQRTIGGAEKGIGQYVFTMRAPSSAVFTSRTSPARPAAPRPSVTNSFF